MALLQILTYPDERLTQESVAVQQFDDELRRFVDDLIATMRAGPGAVGIAAPQVGRFQRVVIVDCSQRSNTPNNGFLVLVNPEITKWDGLEVGREGCLSVPDYTGNVVRATEIEFQAHDVHGELHQYKSTGYEARVVQHECDHLDGMLFLDRLMSRRSDLFRRKVYKK